MGTPSTEHLDLLQLDALRAGEGSAAERFHAIQCAECREMLEALAALATGVRPLGDAPFEIPEQTDRRILWLARKQAAYTRRQATTARRRRMLTGGRWAAAAAVILAVGALTRRQLHQSSPAAKTEVARLASTDDINGDGRVDILDAFALARTLEKGSAAAPAADVTGDGVVDQSDVDAIAHTAVALGNV